MIYSSRSSHQMLIDNFMPLLLSKTIFQANSNDKPEFRYLVGNYAISLLETKNNTP